MAISLPANIYFEYNGYIFPPWVKTKLTETPIMSDDGRTVKYSQLSIQVSGWLTQADAGFTYTLESATVGANGAGYLVGDIVTVQGGTFTQAAQISIDVIDGAGKPTIISIANVGLYTVQPANPVTVAGGAGAGYSPTINWTTQSFRTLDAAMQNIRRRLQVAGKNLRYQNRGYGADLNINGALGDSIRDCAMGPKPGKFTWWPLGGMPDGCHGAGFEWEVSTCIAECASFNPGPGTFVQISFSITYDVDEAGIVTITYAGSAQIPLSLRAAGNLDRNVDEEISAIIRPTPTGFIRRHSRTLSPDRATCTFNIVDKQAEVPPPDDVVFIEMRHRIRQDKPMVPVWHCSISGMIRLSPVASKSLAYRCFWNIVAQRIAFARNQVVEHGIRFEDKNPCVLPGLFEADENLFMNETRFSMSFKLIGAPLADIMRISGLWQKFVTANAPPHLEPWTADSWTASLVGNAQKFKGILGASFNNADEVILDVCQGPVDAAGGIVGRVTAADMSAEELTDEAEDVGDDDFDGVDLDEFAGEEEMYPAETSWVAWVCTPTVETDYHLVRHKPLAGTVTIDTPTVDPFGKASDVGGDDTEPTTGWDADTPDIIQRCASPSAVLRLVGYGVRVAHRVNAPRLISYAGQTLELAHSRIAESTMGASENVTIYRTDWELTFLIAGASSSVPLLANPMLGTDGSA